MPTAHERYAEQVSAGEWQPYNDAIVFSLQEQVAGLAAERDAMRKQIAALVAERDALREQVAALVEDLDALQELVAALVEERDALKEALDGAYNYTTADE